MGFFGNTIYTVSELEIKSFLVQKSIVDKKNVDHLNILVFEYLSILNKNIQYSLYTKEDSEFSIILPKFSSKELSFDDITKGLLEPIFFKSSNKIQTDFSQIIRNRGLSILELIDALESHTKKSNYSNFLVTEICRYLSNINQIKFKEITQSEISNFLVDYNFISDETLVLSFSGQLKYLDDLEVSLFDVGELNNTEWFHLIRRLGLLNYLEENWGFLDSKNSKNNLTLNKSKMADILCLINRNSSTKLKDAFRKYYGEQRDKMVNQNKVEEVLRKLGIVPLK